MQNIGGILSLQARHFYFRFYIYTAELCPGCPPSSPGLPVSSGMAWQDISNFWQATKGKNFADAILFDFSNL
jgi:hypothetical protein